MTWNRKLRVLGVALCLTASASMVTTPTYAAAPSGGGQRIAFHTNTAVLQVVKQENAALYQRLLAYRSGQDVKVSAKERAYLQRVNRMMTATQARATEFSSQSRVLSAEARQAYAQEKKTTTVVVAPDPWAFWRALPGWLTGTGTALTPFFPVAAILLPIAIVIGLIVAIVEAFMKLGPAIAAVKLPK